MSFEYLNPKEIKGDVYIVPFTCIGVAAYHMLKKNGVRVVGFCDNSESYKGKSYNGVSITPPSEACSENPGDTYIVATPESRGDVAKQLKALGAENIIDAGQILTQNNFHEALNDMDVPAVSELTGAPNPKNNACRFASYYWRIKPGLDNILYKNVRYSFFSSASADTAYENFKEFLDKEKKGIALFDMLKFLIQNFDDAKEKIKPLLKIIDYVKQYDIPILSFIIEFRFSKSNEDNFASFLKLLAEYGVFLPSEYNHSFDFIERSKNPNETRVSIKFEPAYSDIENSRRCLFVHIPKAAGTSMLRFLAVPGALSHSNHKRAVDCKASDNEKFERFFKFAIIRNPWDFLVSYYFYFCTQKRKDAYNGLSGRANSNVFLENETFRDVILSLDKSPKLPYRYQYEWICDENDNILVDYIGRFENLEETFRYVGKKLGIDRSKPIPHANAGNHRRYQDYYDDETVEIVRRVFKKDIELFGYEFDKHPGDNIVISSRDDFVPGYQPSI